eukprot:467993-Pyramimonas_sp.AAC.1
MQLATRSSHRVPFLVAQTAQTVSAPRALKRLDPEIASAGRRVLPKLMELVGLGYSAWFVYRYLLFKVRATAFCSSCIPSRHLYYIPGLCTATSSSRYRQPPYAPHASLPDIRTTSRRHLVCTIETRLSGNVLLGCTLNSPVK